MYISWHGLVQSAYCRKGGGKLVVCTERSRVDARPCCCLFTKEGQDAAFDSRPQRLMDATGLGLAPLTNTGSDDPSDELFRPPVALHRSWALPLKAQLLLAEGGTNLGSYSPERLVRDGGSFGHVHFG